MTQFRRGDVVKLQMVERTTLDVKGWIEQVDLLFDHQTRLHVIATDSSTVDVCVDFDLAKQEDPHIGIPGYNHTQIWLPSKWLVNADEYDKSIILEPPHLPLPVANPEMIKEFMESLGGD